MATMDVGLNKTFGWQQWTLNKINLFDGNNGRWAKLSIWMATMMLGYMKHLDDNNERWTK